MKVLVVDDEPLARLVLQAAVERLGHEWTAAESGEAAWERFTADQPDVLVTDLLMPGMHGLELCRRVREHDASHGRYTYVILVTVLGDRKDVVRGMEAGADDYLVKPVELFDLQSRLIAARRVTALHTELDAYRAELSRLAHTDPLTRLGNRLSMEADLAALDARGRRYGHRYCLAICDVDLFKTYNDALGHQAGDEALQAVAARMKHELRAGDGVYRYGGEEFLLVLPEQTLETAGIAVDRVRAAVEELAIPHPASPSGLLTMSAGVAAFTPAPPAPSTSSWSRPTWRSTAPRRPAATAWSCSTTSRTRCGPPTRASRATPRRPRRRRPAAASVRRSSPSSICWPSEEREAGAGA